MKKLLLLPILVFFAACSTEDTTTELPHNTKRTITLGTPATITVPSKLTCNLDVESSVYIDLSQGIQRPVAVFTADVNGGSPTQYYRASIQIEKLSDCEDFNSGDGKILQFDMPDAVQNPSVNSPIVRVDGGLLPSEGCYRWRFMIEGASGPKSKSSCLTITDWYEGPLF